MDAANHQERAREFLRTAHLFRLGRLPTEQPHPATLELSRWARDDLPRALGVLKEIDVQALLAAEGKAAAIDRLSASVQATLTAGRRVFLCGCGATGRLSLTLEYLWRQQNPGNGQVLSFMAGGDVALVHSLEGFEDHPEYGARHLEELGFADGDLLVACTEGGETPYVIGATERAAALSTNRPFFLYCNSDAALIREVERFRRVHDNPRIERICLHVGPMALAGSTRMQASTVLQLAVGLALLHPTEPARVAIGRFRRKVRDSDFSFLADFIAQESWIYRSGHRVVYRVSDYGITVFTDTTERAPTFSLAPFEQLDDRRPPRSLCYVVLDEAGGGEESWFRLLSRAPRPLDWPEVDSRTTPEYLRGFDFSVRALDTLRLGGPGVKHHEFRILRSADGIGLRLDHLSHQLTASGLPELFQHLLLKEVLNIHSTLVMGRIGRYEGNLMTWVQPTNGKLVDRAARYVGHLLAQAGHDGWRYDDLVRQIFLELARSRRDESVVLKACRSLLRGGGGATMAEQESA